MEEVLTIRRPDDWHLHLRDGDILRVVAPLTARQFGRALVMPNLKPPVVTVADARAYRDRIQKFAPDLDLVMTLYLTDQTTPEMVAEAAQTDFVRACKLYPAGATTNSASGVTSLDKMMPVFAAMEQHGLVLCIHGEVTNADMFDRERQFVKHSLETIVDKFQRLKVVLEHVSTKEAVKFVLGRNSDFLAATVTPQHLCFDRSAIFENSRLHHDMFCLPILKEASDREAIRAAVASGSSRFFAGTDSAPHPLDAKYSGAAGVFSAPAAVELYTEAFAEMDALAHLQAFLSENGAKFYGVGLNQGTITLRKAPHKVPESIHVSDSIQPLVPMRAGQTLSWTLGCSVQNK
mmetsp:Transcript_6979/g.21244  ORF Transcript_6979/g.21244 Transcript_6979/m.21244 type:complete len:348 (+) Transcript_6979:151-1194(+)